MFIKVIILKHSNNHFDRIIQSVMICTCRFAPFNYKPHQVRIICLACVYYIDILKYVIPCSRLALRAYGARRIVSHFVLRLTTYPRSSPHKGVRRGSARCSARLTQIAPARESSPVGSDSLIQAGATSQVGTVRRNNLAHTLITWRPWPPAVRRVSLKRACEEEKEDDLLV
jgi:hypothetical protein